MSVRPTGTPYSRVRSTHSPSEGPDLIQAGETDNPINLADEPSPDPSSGDDRFPPDRVDYSASPMRESPTRSNPNAETTQREAPTEVVTEAQAEIHSQAETTVRTSDPGPSERRPSPPVTQAEEDKEVTEISDEEPLAAKEDRLLDRELAKFRAKLNAEKRQELERLKAELRRRQAGKQRQEESSAEKGEEETSGDESSEKGDKTSGRKRKKPSRAQRKARQQEIAEATAAKSPPPDKAPASVSEGPSKVAKLREVVQHNQNLQGRGAGRGSPAGGRGQGRGRGAILVEPQTTVGPASTPSSSHIEVTTPRGTPNLGATPVEEEVAEAEYLRAQDYESSRILSASDLRVAGSVLFRIRRESDKWLKLPDKAIDSKQFHFAPDSIKKASVTLIQYRLRCTRTDKSLHTTSFPSQSDYLSAIDTYLRDPLPDGAAEYSFLSWGETASVELLGAWLTQGNVQLCCARTILNGHPPDQLRPLLESFISVLLKVLKACRDIVQDYSKDPAKGRGKAKENPEPKPGLTYKELSAAAQVLWIGEELITCAQNMYKRLLK